MSKVSRGIVAVSALAALAFGLSPAKAAPTGNPDISLCSPTGHTFTRAINNQYLPMPQVNTGGGSFLLGVFVGPESDGTHGVRISVLPGKFTTVVDTNTVVDANIVEEFEWLDTDGDGVRDANELVIEISRNYFAQTIGTPSASNQPGTVCYFGEDVDIWENGTLHFENTPPDNHHGAWHTGDIPEGGTVKAQPGIVMPAAPKTSMKYFQESAAPVALDQAAVVGTGTVKGADGTPFADGVRTREFTSLEKGTSFKTYVACIGLFASDALQLVSSTEPKPGCTSGAARRGR